MENAQKIWSIQQIKSLERANPYAIGSFIFNASGEVFTIAEALDIWEELQGEALYYSVNWESDLLSESGERIPAVYVEH